MDEAQSNLIEVESAPLRIVTVGQCGVPVEVSPSHQRLFLDFRVFISDGFLWCLLVMLPELPRYVEKGQDEEDGHDEENGSKEDKDVYELKQEDVKLIAIHLHVQQT